MNDRARRLHATYDPGKGDMPHVAVVSMGGTIASTAQARGGAAPRLTAGELVAAVPQLGEVADVSSKSFRTLPSPEITLNDVADLSDAVRREFNAGADGVVVTQGTDTLEETAFALDLLVSEDNPVVVTGAMRHPGTPGSDGPANLLAAVRTASAACTRGLGTVVVMNDAIHAARLTQKTHTSNPATFQSRNAGPIGWISEDRVRIVLRPEPRSCISRAGEVPPVGLVTLAMGDDGRLLKEVISLGYQGLVLEGFGGGHARTCMVDNLAQLAAKIPVVLCSRTGTGEILQNTYGVPGAEIDLLSRGLIPGGALDGLKARVLLSLLLAAGGSRAHLAEQFKDMSV